MSSDNESIQKVRHLIEVTERRIARQKWLLDTLSTRGPFFRDARKRLDQLLADRDLMAAQQLASLEAEARTRKARSEGRLIWAKKLGASEGPLKAVVKKAIPMAMDIAKTLGKSH